MNSQPTSPSTVDPGQDIVVPPAAVPEMMPAPDSAPPASLPNGGQADLAAAVFLGRARRRSRRYVIRSQRRLNRAAWRIDRQRARQAGLLVRAGHRQHDLVRHPDGGQETLADLRRSQTAQRAQIEDEMARGSRKHQRLPRWIGHVPKLVLLVDFCLLLYFFAGITDVDWSSPLSAELAFAGLLAAMVTLLVFGFLAFAGYRLRSYKDHSGTIAFGDLDGLTRSACMAATVGMAVIAVLMFIRMRTEVLYALGPQGWVTALVIAVVLAVVSLLANFLVVSIHALDGSDEVARVQVLSAATSGPLSRAHRMQEKAALISHRIAVRQRRAARAAVRAVTVAGRQLAAAGPSAPEVDVQPLRLTLEHIDTALPEINPSQPG